MIENRRIKYHIKIIADLQSSELHLSKSFVSSSFMQGLGKKLKTDPTEMQHLLIFQSIKFLISFLDSGKDMTRGS